MIRPTARRRSRIPHPSATPAAGGAEGRGGRGRPRGARKAAGGKRGPYKKREKKTSDLLGPQEIERPQNPKLIDAMRQAIATLRGPFSVEDCKAKLITSHPEMEKRISGVVVNLIDMAQGGELKREGTGREARYTVIKLKSGPLDREKAYQNFRATVPAPPPDDD